MYRKAGDNAISCLVFQIKTDLHFNGRCSPSLNNLNVKFLAGCSGLNRLIVYILSSA